LGKQVSILILLLLISGVALAQSGVDVVNPRYDERKVVTYGFSLGFRTVSYRMKYSDLFVTPSMDSVHSIMPRKTPGFSLGFIVNFKLLEFLDVRVTPTVAFAEYHVQFNYVGANSVDKFIESTSVEFPLLLKYKSQRRKNTRMYLVGGLNSVIEAASRSKLAEDKNKFQIEQFNLAMEIGFGFDLYFPLFKFSPEVRFSYGLLNVLSPVKNELSAGIDEFKTKAVSFYFHFQ
jgi:hypothetical protein